MSGEVRKAVIRRIAEARRIPIAAAAHAYACMTMAKKQALCVAEQRKRPQPPVSVPAAREGR